MKLFNWLFNKKTKYLIQVNYKSGISMEFWVYYFRFKDNEYSWEAAHDDNKPLFLGVDNIESVWQIGYIIGRS